jgi:hypothetical protein
MSNGHNDDRLADEAMDQLRAANPAVAPELDAKGHTMYEQITNTEPKSPTPAWKRWPVAAGAFAAVGAIAVAAVILVSGGGNGDGTTAANPDTDPTMGPDVSLGSCIGYTVEELQLREFAFAGTATDVGDGIITFEVDEVYNGDPGETITLEGDTSLMNSMYTDFQFEVGEQYLVSGEDTFAWGCGFTRPYTEDLAAEWAAAFEG